MTGRRRWAIVLVAVALLATACGGSTEPGSAGADAESGDGSAATGTATADPAATDGDVGRAPEPDPERPPDQQGPGLTEAEQAELEAAIDTFVGAPSATAARPVVELMGRSGELRYTAWLLDLFQLGLSNLLGGEIIDVLGDLTGQETTGRTFRDFGRIGGLIETWGIEGGPGYRDWKVAVFSRFDPGFGSLLASVGDDEHFTRIRYGGVPRGGIPELNQPARLSAAEAAEWITDDEIVLGVDLGGEAVAYPFRIIGHHELVNDEVGGIPVAMVYCTLCRTGLLFDRRVEDRVLEFETSGLLANSNKVMVDRQTDTLWQHTAGVAIGGELDGTRLDLFPLETTSWAEWLADHPDTEVIDKPGPIFFDDPERPPIAYRYEVDAPYASYYASDETLFPVRQAPDTFAEKAEVIGVELSGRALAVSVEAVIGGPARFFPVGTGGVVVVPNSRGARVYDASASGLTGTGPQPGDEVEVTDSTTEEAVLAGGERLPRLVVDQGFWFSWWDRHPDTAVWPTP